MRLNAGVRALCAALLFTTLAASTVASPRVYPTGVTLYGNTASLTTKKIPHAGP